MVTIEGTNLGHRVEQVRDAVTVAGQPCPIQARLYVVSVKSVHQECVHVVTVEGVFRDCYVYGYG